MMKKNIRVRHVYEVFFWVSLCFVFLFCFSNSCAGISDSKTYNTTHEGTLEKRKRKIILFVMRRDNNATLGFVNKLNSKYKFAETSPDNKVAYRFVSEKYSGLRFISMKINFKIKDKLSKDLEIGSMYMVPEKARKKQYLEE